MRKGFSLVELMIVVAIIGILAAIAIPNFISMQAKSKRAEVPSNVDGIKTAELAYDASFDAYVDAPTDSPTGAGNKAQIAWSAGHDAGFDTLGWSPDGDVRGLYRVDADNSSSPATFTVTGTSDVDGDGNSANYTASPSKNATLAAGHESIY